MRRRAGFTLFEVMVVIMIISVLASLSMPMMKGSFQNARIKGAARDLAGFMRFARNTAVLRERPCQVVFDLEKDNYRLVLLDERGKAEDLGKRQERREKKELGIGEEAAGVRVLPKDVHFAMVYSGASLTEDKELPRVIYFQDGSATPATIVIQDPGKRAFNIEIYQTTGIARVETGLPASLPNKSKIYVGPKGDREAVIR